jgi:hypothetical protein
MQQTNTVPAIECLASRNDDDLVRFIRSRLDQIRSGKFRCELSGNGVKVLASLCPEEVPAVESILARNSGQSVHTVNT